MDHIRKAALQDAGRIAEIEVFNYRLNFYPIFHNDWFYFDEMQVAGQAAALVKEPARLENTFVYDDGVVKGFVRLDGNEIEKLFVEPVLQGRGIGAALMEHALIHGAERLWALEKNVRAIRFYSRFGFVPSGERKLEEDTDEYLIELKKK